MDLIGPLLLQVFLIVLNAIFASAEIAIISSSSVKMEKLASEGDKRAKRILALTKNPSRFLSTIQVAITLSALLGSAYAADSFAEPLATLILKTGINLSFGVVSGACVLLITIVLSYFSIVFGELVPKRMAMKNPDKTALKISGLLYAVACAFKPFVWVLTKSTNGILRLLGINPDEQDNKVTEEELKMMLKTSSQQGEINKRENELIQNVFEFDDISVGEICTHRKDVDILYTEDSFAEWKRVIANTRHSFYPVCTDNSDNVVGILNVKRFFRSNCRNVETAIEKAVDKAIFVPENMKADGLFTMMRELRNYYAIVVDEYGGTTGVITMHDLLEVLVGDLNDKDDVVVVEIEKIEEGKWKILGSASISDVSRALDIEIDATGIDTFGGYIMGILGTIPDDGSNFDLETEQLSISVTLIDEHRIEETIVTKKETVRLTENNEE